MTKGSFPNCLKTTVVTPIYKQGDVTNPANYRPISLIPVIGKLFERLLDARLKSFISATCNFDCNQFGFLRNSSTNSALLQTQL